MARARTLSWGAGSADTDHSSSSVPSLDDPDDIQLVPFDEDDDPTYYCSPSDYGTPGFSSLPEELCVRVFRYLDPIRDKLPHLALVCRKWRAVLRRATVLWRRLYVDPSDYQYSHFELLMGMFRVYGTHIQSLSWKDSAPVYEPVFALISRLHNLKYLRLPVLWTQKVVDSLSTLRMLEKVDVHGGFALTDENLLQVARQFPRLRMVSLHACWSVTAAGVCRFLEQLPHIQTLKMKVNSSLRLSDYRSESAMREGLSVSLSVSEGPWADCVSVLCLHFVPIETDEVSGLVSRLRCLKKLSLSNCENIHAIRLKSDSLQKLYLFNLWAVQFVTVTAPALRMLTIDHGLESLEHVMITAARMRRLMVDGSDVLRSLQVTADRLQVLELYHCADLDAANFEQVLSDNKHIVCLRLGKLQAENLALDEVVCPNLQELCLLSDFAANCVHIRSPTLRLIHTQAEVDLASLNQMFVVANHLCKVSLVGVPSLKHLAIQCVTIDTLELNLCSDDQLTLESFIVQAIQSIGLLRLFDCKVNLLSVCTPLARTVVLYRCHMSDYVLQMALTGCPNIAHLNLEMCTSLTSVKVSASPMKYLNLFGCAQMHRVDLRCPELIGLNLGHCPEVRLCLDGRERDLRKPLDRPKTVLPKQSTRWTHGFPPKPYQTKR